MAIKVKESGFAIWKVLVILAAIIVLAGAAGFGIVLHDSTGVHLDSDVKISVEEGDGADSVAEKLKENGVIKYPLVFKLISRMNGYDSEFQPGAATITNGMSYSEILDELIAVDRDTVKVVIPEGYEVSQIKEALKEAGLKGADTFDTALDPSLYNYKFLQNLPNRTDKLEGYLFPSTYLIPKDYTGQQIVDLMLKTFDQKFTDEYYKRAQEMGKSVDQIITMASIIERETDSDTERAKVAGVFYNRLNKGMKLQSCATVQYVLGSHKPVLSIADTEIDSPYNTYKYAGLPVGPIANPGEDCIKAALYPEETDAFYFCLGKNGEHIFSKTYEEHVAAMEANDLVTTVDSEAIENEDSKK